MSSKTKRLQFAEAVGNANEECGTNDDDGMYMDFHNNRIGRELFNQNSSYKKKKVWFVTITYGLNLPSTSKLRELTRTKVNAGSFIDNNGNITENVNDINNANSSQVVYISEQTN